MFSHQSTNLFSEHPFWHRCSLNYRPVSHLSFLSKVLGRIILPQLNEQEDQNNLLSPFQSSHRPNNEDNFLTAMDNNKICIITLSDLSTVFETKDPLLLFTRLQHLFGISDSALSWFTSYIFNRTQAIIINSLQSQNTISYYGVPQGSVLGPVLFILCCLIK